MALHQTQTSQEWEKIFQCIEQPILILNPECDILDANQSAMKAIGASIERIKGKKCFKIVHHAEQNPKGCPLEQVLNSGHSETVEMKFETPDGVFLVSCTPIFDDSGNLQRVIHVMTNITAIKSAEEALRISEERTKRLAQENTIIVIAEIGRIIGSTLEIDKVYEVFAEEVRKVIPFDRVAITIIDHERGTFYNAYLLGDDVIGHRLRDVVPMAGSFTEGVMRRHSGQLIQTEDRAELAGRFPALLPHFDSGTRSFMAVPLISKDQVIGVLHIFSTKSKAYTEADANLAENISAQIAGAIANSQLYAELKRSEEEQKRLVIQLQDALANIKTLHGLIPICASCKKIRDDKGYWNQIESYIRDHSEAEFSHGICPECLRKLYPNLDLDKDS